MFLFENRQRRKHKRTEIKENCIQKRFLMQQDTLPDCSILLCSWNWHCQCWAVSAHVADIQVFYYQFVNLLLEMCLGRQEAQRIGSCCQTLILFLCAQFQHFKLALPLRGGGPAYCVLPFTFTSLCGGCRELDQFPGLLRHVPAQGLVLAEGRG